MIKTDPEIHLDNFWPRPTITASASGETNVSSAQRQPKGKPFALDKEHLSEWENTVEWLWASGTEGGERMSKRADMRQNLCKWVTNE